MKNLHTILSLLALSSTVALASTDSAPTDVSTTNASSSFAVSAEAFYGFDKSDNDIDIAGVTVRLSFTPEKARAKSFSHDIFAACHVGYGDDETQTVKYHGTIGIVSAGATIRLFATESVSLFARGEVGFAVVWSEFSGQCNEAVGTAYDVGLGVQFNITPTQGVTVAVDYLGTTAEPEARISDYTFTADKPEYITLSVGYKFSF